MLNMSLVRHSVTHSTIFQGLTSEVQDISYKHNPRFGNRPSILCHQCISSVHCEEETICTRYADDTYIVIPTSNAQFREVELGDVAELVQRNNLKLNRAKFVVPGSQT